MLNETRVIAARLFGTLATGGAVELLLLQPAHGHGFDPQATEWHALARPGRKLQPGRRVYFGDAGEAEILRVLDGGVREVRLATTLPFERFLERCGRLPLPPYIKNDSREAQERYQTVFARTPGSVAAPTASLHFTDGVFEALAQRGVEIGRLSLDVGLGTFRPMQTERVGEHRMHSERFTIPPETAGAVARAHAAGRRVVAAGTTVMRALEGSAAAHGAVTAGEEATELFITPGFRFRAVDALITNFHLPKSTLLVLVSAFAGRERVLAAYREAIARGYRFFSFGDAMLVERQP